MSFRILKRFVNLINREDIFDIQSEWVIQNNLTIIFNRRFRFPDIEIISNDGTCFLVDVDLVNDIIFSEFFAGKYKLSKIISDLENIDEFEFLLKYGRIFTDEFFIDKIQEFSKISTLNIEDFSGFFNL